jgi:hypothetical protein
MFERFSDRARRVTALAREEARTLNHYIGTEHILLRLLREGERVLATSREALGVAGEVSWRVRLLSVPDPRHPSPVEALKDFEAVRLFVERARARLPGFVLSAADEPAVVQVGRPLDGSPLAIELAAAQPTNRWKQRDDCAAAVMHEWTKR